MSLEVSELCVPVPWGEIRGQVWGPDHGRPVLCLHGWADNCGTFNTLIPLLPKGMWRWTWQVMAAHRIVPLELSTAFLRTWRMYAEWLMVSLQLKKFSIIGHSMGADIAGMFSALYPEMVDALVLLDAYGFVATDSKEVSKMMRQGMDEMIQFEKKTDEKKRVYTYEKAVERLSTANPTLPGQSVHILLERGLVEVEGGFVFSRDLRVHFKNILRLSLEQSLEMQARIQASVLVV
ncbi:hypothetical protein INR49_030939, partial [Caranx melampygus]